MDLPEQVMWKASVVEQELLMSIEKRHPPPQIIVGSDAKFNFLLLRHFPVWLQDFLQRLVMKTSVQPKLMRE